VYRVGAFTVSPIQQDSLLRKGPGATGEPVRL